MPIKLYNTFSRKLEEFKSIEKDKVRMYNCGPTVYDYVHIGNFRTYLMADFLRRMFEYSGYEVKQIKNITDVGHLTQDDIEAGEDKMLKAAKREKKSPYDIARFYEKSFHEDETKLNILPAFNFPRATEYIPQMIEMIKKLIEKGFAYEVKGSVYYDVDKFADYGKLSGNTLENLKIGARLEAHPDKKNPYDFALWLKADPDHLMQWDSPWSRGYPGWHIECSAMSSSNLGETIDVHTGGEDNVFPHHEDEIAQSEGASGKKFVNYWIHGRHLLVDGEKMSKSKGNFYPISEFEKRKIDPISFRYLCLTTHFTSQLNFTWKSLEAGQNALNKMIEFMGSDENKGEQEEGYVISEFDDKFRESLENNLDTPKALATAWEMIRSKDYSACDKKETLLKFDRFFGFNLKNIKTVSTEIPENIQKLSGERLEARKNKDWKRSDELRDLIEKKGFSIKDTKDGQIIKKK
ncbi:MAG: cysteine--tRNA ligase [Candidatus Paceibacterota bacterium]